MQYTAVKLLLGSDRSTLRRFSVHRTVATKHKCKIPLQIPGPQNSNIFKKTAGALPFVKRKRELQPKYTKY
jgi:hypothetical protein